MTKLSQPMIVALHEIYAKAIKSNITVKAQTLTALDKRGLITDGELLGEPAIFLTDAGKESIGVVTLAEILPGESVEVTGSYAGGHSQEQILELLGEVDDEYDNHPMVTVEQETSLESVEAPVFKLTRRMVREARRNVARYNRRLMRLQGKRARKYGAQNVIIKFIAA